MAKRIIVLGAGLVGNAIARDLSKSGYTVTSVDTNRDALNQLASDTSVIATCDDFTDPVALKNLVKEQDLVIGAAPGALGFNLMKEVIGLAKNMVDISFCPEDYLSINELAIKNNTTVVADMGVAPGICNAMLGFHDTEMKVKSYKCIVGGLPEKRHWPLEYKSSWSPIDCIEEYTRPARFRQQGKLITRPALSDPELVDFDEVGTLEEWNSDGLRSLLFTMPHIPDMIEKTLRYPGTIKYLRALRDLGYFSTEEVEVKGSFIRPIDLSARLLFPNWKLEKGEKEFTIMRVTIEGEKNGKTTTIQYDLYDEYDPVSDTLSMARTTGYTCTGVAELILNGNLSQKGVLAPEQVGAENGAFTYLLKHLEQRGVNYRKSQF